MAPDVSGERDILRLRLLREADIMLGKVLLETAYFTERTSASTEDNGRDQEGESDDSNEYMTKWQDVFAMTWVLIIPHFARRCPGCRGS